MFSRSVRNFFARPQTKAAAAVMRTTSTVLRRPASIAATSLPRHSIHQLSNNLRSSLKEIIPIMSLRSFSSSSDDARPSYVIPPPSMLARALLHAPIPHRLRYLYEMAVYLFSDVTPKGFGRFGRKSEDSSASKKADKDEDKDEDEDEEEDKPKKKKKEDKDAAKTKEDRDKKKEGKEKEKDEDEEEEEEEEKKEDKRTDEQKAADLLNQFKNREEMNKLLIGACLLAAFLTWVMFNIQEGHEGGHEIDWTEFRKHYLEPGLVDHLEVVKGAPETEGGADTWPLVIIHLKQAVHAGDHAVDQAGAAQQDQRFQETKAAVGQHGPHAPVTKLHMRIGSVDMLNRNLEVAQRAMGLSEKEFVKVQYRVEKPNTLAHMLAGIIPTLLIIGFLGWQMKAAAGKRGGIMGVGKHGATKIMPGDPKQTVRFKDVAGLDEAKVEVMEFVKFLKNPEKFTGLGAKIPKGALLVGPPGTGKTLLAKAMAGEASVPFFSMSGSDFVEMFVGVGASRVRDLFQEARGCAPCIVWIDEIDAVAKQRASGSKAGFSNEERENTLNQLLVELDGFTASTGVVVLAGTNRVDILDKALLRPGRFDRIIGVDKPDLHGRAQIFRVHLKKIKTKHDRRDLSARLAALTPGMVGADIANICNEAAIIAARAEKKYVELVDFERATDRVLAGMEKKHQTMSPMERRLIAYHEAGHAVTGWFLEHSEPLLKVTIVARSSGALGFAQYLPKELRLYQQDQLEDMMCMALGGRAAEQTFFGKISTGASDDLKKVTRIANSAITVYGMSSRPGLNNVSYVGDDNQFQKPYSEDTAKAIDEEVAAMVAKAYTRALELVEKHKEQIKALAERLLAVETVTHDALVEILGKRPFPSDAYTEFIQSVNTPLQTKAEKKKAEREKEQREREERLAQEELEKRARESDGTPQPA